MCQGPTLNRALLMCQVSDRISNDLQQFSKISTTTNLVYVMKNMIKIDPRLVLGFEKKLSSVFTSISFKRKIEI